MSPETSHLRPPTLEDIHAAAHRYFATEQAYASIGVTMRRNITEIVELCHRRNIPVTHPFIRKQYPWVEAHFAGWRLEDFDAFLAIPPEQLAPQTSAPEPADPEVERIRNRFARDLQGQTVTDEEPIILPFKARVPNVPWTSVPDSPLIDTIRQGTISNVGGAILEGGKTAIKPYDGRLGDRTVVNGIIARFVEERPSLNTAPVPAVAQWFRDAAHSDAFQGYLALRHLIEEGVIQPFPGRPALALLSQGT
jgi:hypothetical protein